jgi:hypothetical protein
MPIRLGILNQVMVQQAATLSNVNKRQLEGFAKYLDKIVFSEEHPTTAETEAYRFVFRELNKCPQTKLEITKVRRDLLRISLEPSDNAVPFLFPLYEGENPDKIDFSKQRDRFSQIMYPAQGLSIKIDSSIGTLHTGAYEFKLYGALKDYDDPGLVEKYIGSDKGYPVERLSASNNSMSIKIQKFEDSVPAFILIGNLKPDYCKEGLVYVSTKFDDSPKEFYDVLANRAAFFAIHHLRCKRHIEGEKAISRFEKEIIKLERIV